MNRVINEQKLDGIALPYYSSFVLNTYLLNKSRYSETITPPYNYCYFLSKKGYP